MWMWGVSAGIVGEEDGNAMVLALSRNMSDRVAEVVAMPDLCIGVEPL